MEMNALLLMETESYVCSKECHNLCVKMMDVAMIVLHLRTVTIATMKVSSFFSQLMVSPNSTALTAGPIWDKTKNK